MAISPNTSLPYLVTDVAKGEGSLDETLNAYLQADASTPFDLVEGPPIRVRLFKLSEADHALVLTVHHIICDGWSINVIVTELAEIYSSLREQRATRSRARLAVQRICAREARGLSPRTDRHRELLGSAVR